LSEETWRAAPVCQTTEKGEVPCALPDELHDFLIPGNLLKAGKHDNPSGVMEVTPDKRVVFAFSTTGQVWSCQRMADGNTLVGAASQGKLLVVNPAAKVIKTIQVLNPPGHSCLRNARQIADGHFLVAEESAHAAREYSAAGKTGAGDQAVVRSVLGRAPGEWEHGHLRPTNDD